MEASLLVDKLVEIFQRTATVVVVGLRGSLAEKLDGRVRLDAVVAAGRLDILGIAVGLGNDDVGVKGVIDGKLLPYGG